MTSLRTSAWEATVKKVLSSYLIKYSREQNGRQSRRNVYLVKIGPKSLGDGRQDICQDKESNLRQVAG